MNVPWWGIFCGILAVAAFHFAYSLLLKKSKRGRVQFAMLSGVLALPGLSMATYYTHHLPEMSWYYAMRALTGFELVLVFVGVFWGAVASVLPRKLLTLPLLACCLFSFVPFIKPVLRPLVIDASIVRWDGDVCKQTTASSCGPASCATALRSLGIEAYEYDLAREAYTYAGGTEAWYLARAIRQRGGKVTFEMGDGFVDSMKYPAVVGVITSGAGHFIAFLGKDGANYLLADPMYGG